MAQHDLTHVLAKHLDRHLVFPLLEFLQEKGLYAEEDIMRAKLALLNSTNLVDFAIDIHKMVNRTDDVPAEMQAHRTEVVAKLRKLQADTEPLIAALGQPAVIKNFRKEQSFNVAFLAVDFHITQAHIDALYAYAKFQFDCGAYGTAAELLEYYRALCTHPERSASATWGKLAADILMQDFDKALDDVAKLRELVDGGAFSQPLQQLQQRTWLMHWALFAFWNHENGRNALIDLYFQTPYLHAIQINGQHLLRYLATAVIINKRRRSVLRDLIRLIQQEAYQYSDPITQFLECLFVHYDFDGAQQKLKECEKVIDADFFLAACREEFLENARLFIFETYCRIHQCIDIGMLSERLSMGREAAEKWIANLILNARLNAKIDAKAGTVVMGTQTASVHDTLADKCKSLSARTFALANAVVGTAAAAPAPRT